MESLRTLIPKNSILADIGTDHGYLPVLAVKDHTVKKAYACDVAPGPLSQAEEHIASAGYQDQITAVLSNGFEHVPMDASAAVIAGMGFYTARDILDAALERLPLLTDIIVQINSDVPLLREWISSHHYTIKKELSIFDRKFYTAVVFDTSFHAPYSKAEVLRGPLEAILDRDTFKAHLSKQIEKERKILSLRGRDEKLEEELSILEETLRLLQK